MSSLPTSPGTKASSREGDGGSGQRGGAARAAPGNDLGGPELPISPRLPHLWNGQLISSPCSLCKSSCLCAHMENTGVDMQAWAQSLFHFLRLSDLKHIIWSSPPSSHTHRQHSVFMVGQVGCYYISVPFNPQPMPMSHTLSLSSFYRWENIFNSLNDQPLQHTGPQ